MWLPITRAGLSSGSVRTTTFQKTKIRPVLISKKHIFIRKTYFYQNLAKVVIITPKTCHKSILRHEIYYIYHRQYLFLIIKYTVLGKCWLGTFPYFSECIPKKRVSRRRTSVLGGTRNCTEKWPSQQVPRKGIFYDQNYIFSHADRVFFGSIWTNSNIRSLRVPLFYSSNPNLHKQSWWLRMLRR